MNLQMFADPSQDPTAQAPADDPKVKLDDGTEIALSELKKGYMRQADYTKKTQETAALRREAEAITSEIGQFRPLVDLIKSDPNAAQAVATTLEALANGQAPTQQQVQQVTQAAAATGDDAAVDAALQVEILRFEIDHRDDIDAFKAEGKDFTTELLDYCVEHHIEDFAGAGYRAFMYDRIKDRTAAELRSEAEKRANTPAVGGGGAAGVPSGKPEEPNTPKQSWAAAGKRALTRMGQ